MFTQQSSLQTFAYFSCSGLDSRSLLKSGYFQQLLNFDINLISDPALKLCGNQSTSSFLFNNIKQTFLKIKQNFYRIRDLSMVKLDCFNKGLDNCDSEVLRMDILKIFHIILPNIQKLNSSYNQTVGETDYIKNILGMLVNEIKLLLTCVGSISSIKDVKTIVDFDRGASKCAFNFYQFYHLCLDLWYNCLVILYYIAYISMPVDFKEKFCDFIEPSSAFMQVASFLIYDLSFLSINRYINANMPSDSPFTCPCIKDIWIMLIQLCDNLNALNNSQTLFWNLFLTNIQIILKNKSQEVKDISIDKFSAQNFIIRCDTNKLIESCFWLMSHVAPLHKYDNLGHFCEFKKSCSSPVVEKYLIHHLFSDSEVSEKYLRSCLLYCIKSSKLSEASADVLFPLMDFYIRKIDKTFNLQEMSFSYLFKDAKLWFMCINNLSNLVLSGKESSFDYFLSMLSLQFRLDKDNNLWRSLKGRIYSKFMPKKIKEMPEVGLQNTFSLFLAIFKSGESEIVGKICEAASIIETLANPRKQLISWKALFVLLYINREKKTDSTKSTELLSKFFNSACSDYSKISNDSVFKNNLMNVLLVYIQNMNELFRSSDEFSSSINHLISSGFSVLLKSCCLNDQSYILGMILNILQSIERITESNKIDYVVSNTDCIGTLYQIFNNIYPFIESTAVAETDYNFLVVSDIAAILTKLTFIFASSINTSLFDYYEIFMFFVCKDNVNSYIVCHYISLILDYSQIIEEIRLKSVDLDVIIFQSWLKCMINIQTKNDDLWKLTEKVFRLPIIVELIPDSDISRNTEDPIEMAYFLFNTIGNAFKCQSMQEKIKLAKKVQLIFKNYALLTVNKIHRSKDVPTFTHVYKLTSYLVEQCSAVLHMRVSSESILLQILDKIIYPQILFPRDKALQNLASCAIKEHLPHYIHGLFKLDYKVDKSIEREIRDIFIYYIGILPFSTNPLTKLLINSFSQKPDALSSDACLFILETLKSSLLLNNVENPTSIFRFYQEIFQQIPTAYKGDITDIILKTAMEVFMGRKDSTSEFLKVLIKKVLSHFEDKAITSQAKKILEPVIVWFVKEKLQWSIIQGFILLDLFIDHVPHVILELVEFFKKSIEVLELNRGLGEDRLLRNAFQNFISKLHLKLTKSRTVKL